MSEPRETFELNYNYDDAGRMLSISDGTNSMTYTQRSPGGLPRRAAYSSGMQVSWDYDAQFNLSALTYANANGTNLTKFNSVNDRFGKRRSLTVLPTGEHTNYEYDAAMRLARENRAVPVPGLPPKVSDTRYRYDVVGNRTERNVAGKGVDAYVYNNRHELTTASHVDGSATAGPTK